MISGQIYIGCAVAIGTSNMMDTQLTYQNFCDG